MSSRTGSLYLHPSDPWAEPPDPKAVLDALRGLGVLGESFGSGTWLAGDGLLRHITFAGCSPYLEFTPPTDGGSDFCHIALLGPFESPRIHTGPNTLKPRCPACKTRVADWQPLAAAFDAAPAIPWRCPACGAEQGIETLRWRQHAVFGRLLLEIRGVFPAEGVPSDSLLSALEAATGMPWQFGWAASSA
jgi:hypothetical protein